jgi:hypothetical protein
VEMVGDRDDGTPQRIAMFEAAIAAYVLNSLNSDQQPDLFVQALSPTPEASASEASSPQRKSGSS